ncbi:MAG: OmpH family outer membrane protein [Muribaculaceae bacterium]|nr:OmpH family outer membrane protein [Muribaculaceae bacterium]MBR6490598.1 OmpH family outer membrane protein [Muribaculaceae bacterium]
MNYLRISFKMMVVAIALIITMSACSSNEKNDAKKEAQKAAAPLDPNGKLAIRYIDEDSVIKNYNLAKDFQEMATRLENEYDQAGRRFSDQVMNFENSMKQKYQNNQYNEASYNADMKKYQQMQQNAQNELAKMQESSTNQMQQSQKQLNDSIDNFLKDYAVKNHYDVILKKGAGFYFNPNLDITDEVIEGLNKRYTKVAKK